MTKRWRYVVLAGLTLSLAAACARRERASSATVGSASEHLQANHVSSASATPNVLELLPGQTFEPPRVGDTRRPLLLALHGLGGSGTALFEELGLASRGAERHLIVLSPNGTRDAKGRRFWNAGPECCNFDERKLDDVARVGALLDRYAARPDVDAKRIYVLGYSNGGFLAHRLACAFPGIIAAIASIAGAAPRELPHCQVTTPIAILEVHGDQDPYVRYEGGRVFDDDALAVHASAQDGYAAWSKLLGCAGKAETYRSQDLFPELSADESQLHAREGCARGAAALLTVHGGHHALLGEPRVLDFALEYLLSHPKP